VSGEFGDLPTLVAGSTKHLCQSRQFDLIDLEDATEGELFLDHRVRVTVLPQVDIKDGRDSAGAAFSSARMLRRETSPRSASVPMPTRLNFTTISLLLQSRRPDSASR
jgi:hypothetical protein